MINSCDKSIGFAALIKLFCEEVVPRSTLWKVFFNCLFYGEIDSFVVSAFFNIVVFVPACHGIGLDYLFVGVLCLVYWRSKQGRTKHKLVSHVPHILV